MTILLRVRVAKIYCRKRFMWIKPKAGRENCVFVYAYDPQKEEEENAKNNFKLCQPV